MPLKHLNLRGILMIAMLCALCCVPAHALDYTIDAPDDYLFGQPTSDDTIYEWENPNVDRSKNTALVAPGFGTATSYLPGSGEYLTPNLVPGALSGGLVNQVGSAATSGTSSSSTAVGAYPSVDTSNSFTVTQIPNTTTGYTEVTDDLYYTNGSLGTLKIPAIGLSVNVVQGTDSTALAKGAGHFTDSSIWDGNVALAAHNRGTNSYFGKIHTLEAGDTITWTTKLGTRTYTVTSVEKVSVTDSSGTAATTDNRLTLYTCVMDQPNYRWCVTAIQQA
jgi:sortase A